jgi:glycosyltransferase involved in cell wall biosynthesis
LKRQYGVPFIFDMRGFWVDERLEGGRWPQGNPLYRWIYRQWKAKERAFIGAADHIVVLTDAAKAAIEDWPDYRGQPVTVIPCCIDHQDFGVRTQEGRAAARDRLGIATEATVLVYLGSVGTIYLLEDMLRVYARLRTAKPGAKFLFVGWLTWDQISAAAVAAGVEIERGDVAIQPAEHGEVPFWLGAADLAIALRQPSFSSQGASPTKLGEYLACGLPVVVNDGVGDVAALVKDLAAGEVMPDLSEAALDTVFARLDAVLAINPVDLRDRSRRIHDMPVALEKYGQVYDSIAPGAA